MKRTAAFRMILLLISLLMMSGLVFAQEDTRTFEITNDIFINRVQFTYSTAIAQDAVYRWNPASTETDTPTGPVPESVQVAFQNYDDQAGWQETGQYIYIYPTVTFPQSPSYPYAQELANLRAVLAERPNVPDQPLPMLPVVTASQILRTQVDYIDFPGGSGIRYVTAAGLDVSPLSDQSLFYTFQGLTSDEAYYIAAVFPVKSSILPAEPEQMNADQYNQFAAGYDAYITDITQRLGALSPGDFSPGLEAMDNLFASLVVHEPTATYVTEDGAATGSVSYGATSFSYDASLASRVEVDNVFTTFDSPDSPSMLGSQPGYTGFLFYGYPSAAGNNFAKLRILPAYTFPASNSLSDQELVKIRDFLQARPPLTAQSNLNGATNPIPMLPLVNAAQVIVVKPAYLDFQNGSGLRFITFYSQGIEPVTNNAIYYAFIGLTSDGQFVVSAQFPVTTAVLPEIDPTTLDVNALAAGYSDYLAKTVADMDALDASGYTPSLDSLDNLIRSLKAGQ